MAFGWDDLAILAASAYSAYAGNQASGTQAKQGQKAIDLQRQQWLAALNMLEPNRALGYGATSDLASLYGYALPAYTPLSSVTSGSLQSTGPVAVQGARGTGAAGRSPEAFFGTSRNRAFGGSIDPTTGTVNLTGMKNPNKEAKREAAATAYLRGETDRLGGTGMRRIRNSIDDLIDSGYSYTAPDTSAPAAPTAGVTGAPSMERFFTSPDYEFRRSEGLRGMENSAAARGGAFSGNAIRGAAEYSSNLASGEFNNYVSRLMAMAGLGSAATNTAINTGQSTANNIGNLYGAIGNARASGYGANNNAIQGGLQNWYTNRYLQNMGGGGSGYTVPDDIRNFQYPFGG